MFKNIIRKVQVCVPFRLLKEKYLPMVLENRINPEIGIDAEVIDTHCKKDFSKIVSILQQEGLLITLHGPFYYLVQGGTDKKILKASRERLKEAFDFIKKSFSLIMARPLRIEFPGAFYHVTSFPPTGTCTKFPCRRPFSLTLLFLPISLYGP
jgi:hypothetical protein